MANSRHVEGSAMASYDEKCQSPEVEDELRRLRVFDLHCDTLDSLCMRDVEPFAMQLSNTVGGADRLPFL